MPVNEEGFKGGDRTSIDLPKPNQELLEAPDRDWKACCFGACQRQCARGELGRATRQCNSRILVSRRRGWSSHSGNTLGKNNPAGRLPVTFYTGVDQLPRSKTTR